MTFPGEIQVRWEEKAEVIRGTKYQNGNETFPPAAGSDSQEPSSSFIQVSCGPADGGGRALIFPLRCNGFEDQSNMKVFVSSLKPFAQQINIVWRPSLVLVGIRPA